MGWYASVPSLLFVSLALLTPGTASARTRNFSLREQVAGDPERILPRSDLYSLAVDGHGFFRASDEFAGFYHSGYWVDAFGEIRPFSTLTSNARVVIYNPGASYGIITETRIVPFMSFTWHDNLSNIGLFSADAIVRYFDQGRETIGAGLTIEEKEASGLYVELRRADFRFKHFWNGTGGYSIDGDLVGIQYDYAMDTIGFYTFITNGMDTNAVGLYSSKAFLLEGLQYALELSHRRSGNAGLAGLEYRHSAEGFAARIKLQYRRYLNGFADDVTGNIQNDYLSIEQEDKSYTNSANIFTVDDEVSVKSAILNFTYQPTMWLRLFTENELAEFDYKAFEPSHNYFFRHGLAVCLRRNDNLCANVFLSNRMTSAVSHVETQDRENKPFFKKQRFFAVEGRFRF